MENNSHNNTESTGLHKFLPYEVSTHPLVKYHQQQGPMGTYRLISNRTENRKKLCKLKGYSVKKLTNNITRQAFR